jgi:perosamine synthetase
MDFSAGMRNRRTERPLMRSMTTFGDSASDRGVGRLIPRPDIPVQPVLSCGTFLSRRTEAVPAVVDNGHVTFVTSARIAIAHALELAGVQPGQKVLVPAYHCIVMIEPIVHVGAVPIFYRVREDLSVDLDDVEAKTDGETRALIAVNYFGFPQDLFALRQFCDQHGLSFIEDCAHSFFGSFAGQPLGTFGHFAVASLTKFFPVRDGGCLVVGADLAGSTRLSLRSQGLGANIASGVNAVAEAVTLRRLPALSPAVKVAEYAKRLVRTALPTTASELSENSTQPRAGVAYGFDPAAMGIRATAVSRVIVRYASRKRIVEGRRNNYARLVRELSDLKHCRPIFPSLPSHVVPYMFPLWVDHLSEVFATLEDRAVPMQRFGQFLWPEMSADACPVAPQFSHHSVQLPCHEDLTEDEMSVLVERVRAIVA